MSLRAALVEYEGIGTERRGNLMLAGDCFAPTKVGVRNDTKLMGRGRTLLPRLSGAKLGCFLDSPLGFHCIVFSACGQGWRPRRPGQTH
jgi:hypothetical protein